MKFLLTICILGGLAYYGFADFFKTDDAGDQRKSSFAWSSDSRSSANEGSAGSQPTAAWAGAAQARASVSQIEAQLRQKRAELASLKKVKASVAHANNRITGPTSRDSVRMVTRKVG